MTTAKQGPPEQLQYDPAAVSRGILARPLRPAPSWPTAGKPPSRVTAAATASTTTAAAATDADGPSQSVRVGFAELPGSPQAYNVDSRRWESIGEGVDPHVPLLGVAGRVGVVAAGAKHPQAVLQLLLWLSGEPRDLQVSTASTATTLFCRWQRKSPQRWTERPVSAAAVAQYAALTEKTLQRPDYLFALRLPGCAEYLAALDDAVRAAVRGEATPADALKKAACPLAGDHRSAGTGRATGRLSAEPGIVRGRRGAGTGFASVPPCATGFASAFVGLTFRFVVARNGEWHIERRCGTFTRSVICTN